MTEYAVLIGQIQEWLADLERVVNRIGQLLEQAKKTGDRAYLEATAFISFSSGHKAMNKVGIKNTRPVTIQAREVITDKKGG